MTRAMQPCKAPSVYSRGYLQDTYRWILSCPMDSVSTHWIVLTFPCPHSQHQLCKAAESYDVSVSGALA